MDLFDYLRTLPGILVALSIGAGLLVALIALALVWQLAGRGPRTRRGLKRAARRLKEGAWTDALARVRKLRQRGGTSTALRRQLDELEGECLQAATQAALGEGQYEQALEYALQAAHFLDGSEVEARLGVQSAMLREVRRLFAEPGGDLRAVRDMIDRALRVQSPCREASFWQALCDLRQEQVDQALANLQIARGGRSANDGEADQPQPAAPISPFIDPPLYLGGILLRRGQAKESLRFLTEANRLDSGCPFVTLQLGAAIVAAGGDMQLAVRALQRAIGPRGLGQWQDAPQRAWVEGMPEHRSHVRKLAAEFRYVCPLWGPDLALLLRQGQLALAQGQYRLGNYQEAADLFEQALKTGAPSLTVLRGLGLALAKLGRYDDAFKQLRIALDMEEPKDRMTAGYLALCGACGTPTNPEDKTRNIAWAVQAVQQFNAPGDAEWVELIDRIFAEARANGTALSADDQLYLCEHLLTVNATAPTAAAAFHHLAATHPALVRPEYAWLYGRADEQHRVDGAQALALYGLAFADRAAAQAFYAERKWDLAAIEYRYLQRAAALDPGHFPTALGSDYAVHGEELLFERSLQQEQAGQVEDALEAVEILTLLAPQSTRALDRAAALHYRAGRLPRAVDLLERWERARPDDALPLVRHAVLLHEQGQDAACRDCITRASNLCSGNRRAKVAFLGARLLLRSYLVPRAVETDGGIDLLAAARGCLEDCLQHRPDDAEALWCLAAVRWLQGDLQALADQASSMQAANSSDARLHYLAALCHLVAGNGEGVLQASRRTAEGKLPADAHAGRNGDQAGRLDLGLETGYLVALAQIGQGQRGAALPPLRALAEASAIPTRSLALALLGWVQFAERNEEEAIRAWSTLDIKHRAAWGLTEPLAQTMFASALATFYEGQYEQAAEKLRHAGRLGCRDRRLGPLLLLALFKAGQKAIYSS